MTERLNDVLDTKEYMIFCLYCKEPLKSQQVKIRGYHLRCHNEVIEYHKNDNFKDFRGLLLDGIKKHTNYNHHLIGAIKNLSDMSDEHYKRSNTLYIWYINKYPEYFWHYLSSLINLIYISVMNSMLTNEYNQIKKLSNLKQLSLIRIKIQEIPSFVFELRQLEWLDIEDCPISSIQRSITKLDNLTHLTLEKTLISSLPDRMVKMKALEHLTIKHSLITSLPENIGNLQSLRTLSLNSNKSLDQLPKSLSKIALEFIYISDCAFRTIPKIIFKIISLTGLHIGDITITPEEIGEILTALPKLKKISFQNCNITDLPTNILEFRDLKITLIQKNQVILLPEMEKLLKENRIRVELQERGKLLSYGR
jgi:Leucine-rich repeat (LRR) protein